MNLNEMYDKLIEAGAEEQTINVVTCINGWNQQSMEDILYVLTGYRSFDQYDEYEGDVE